MRNETVKRWLVPGDVRRSLFALCRRGGLKVCGGVGVRKESVLLCGDGRRPSMFSNGRAAGRCACMRPFAC